jgi:hypothetical protein
VDLLDQIKEPSQALCSVVVLCVRQNPLSQASSTSSGAVVRRNNHPVPCQVIKAALLIQRRRESIEVCRTSESARGSSASIEEENWHLLPAEDIYEIWRDFPCVLRGSKLVLLE